MKKLALMATIFIMLAVLLLPLFQGAWQVAYASPGPQYARPSADLAIGTWTDNAGGNTNIYLAIDEATADDNDFIQSSALKLSQTDTADIRLSTVTDPVSSTGHIVRYRYRADLNGANPMNITVELRQGDSTTSTLIASQAHSSIPITWTSGNFTLAANEADLITDYGTLFFSFMASASGFKTVTRRSQISWAEFEVPSPPADISNDPNNWNLGTVVADSTYQTGLGYFTVTNNSAYPVTISIHGDNMTGDGVTWFLSDNGEPGENIYALKAGLADTSYNITVPQSFANPLVSNLSNVEPNNSQQWGLQFLAPATFTDYGMSLSANVTLTATTP